MQQNLNIREVKDYDGRTLLHLAASEGAVSSAEWLVATGVDLSAVDRFGRTPLMEALINNHSPVAQLLLQVCSQLLIDLCLLCCRVRTRKKERIWECEAHAKETGETWSLFTIFTYHFAQESTELSRLYHSCSCYQCCWARRSRNKLFVMLPLCQSQLEKLVTLCAPGIYLLPL